MPWYALRTVQALGFRRIEASPPKPTGDDLLTVRPRVERRFGEFDAVKRLRDNGFDAFAPKLSVRVRVGPRNVRRWETRQVPLIPGYCFAAFPAGVPWQRLSTWSEIIDVVRMSGDPYPIPAAQIESLRAVSEALAGDGAARDKSGRAIRTGASVLMDRAAWLGALGTVEAVHRQNVTVLMEFLGAPRRVSVAADELEVVSA